MHAVAKRRKTSHDDEPAESSTTQRDQIEHMFIRIYKDMMQDYQIKYIRKWMSRHGGEFCNGTLLNLCLSQLRENPNSHNVNWIIDRCLLYFKKTFDISDRDCAEIRDTIRSVDTSKEFAEILNEIDLNDLMSRI